MKGMSAEATVIQTLVRAGGRASRLTPVAAGSRLLFFMMWALGRAAHDVAAVFPQNK